MKEMQPESIQFNGEELVLSLSKDLTVQSDPSTLDVRGNIFMQEPGNGEVKAGQPEPQPKTVSPEIAPQSSFTKEVDQIENEQLRKFATDLQNRIKESPLSSWSTKDLRSEYLRLSALTAKLSGTGEFFQRERASADAAPLSRSIIEQLSQRGVDLEALFLEAVSKAETAGTPLRNIGAATLTPADFPDPTLQNIVSELNAEINRVGAGNPLSPIYIDRQINRVQGLTDQGQVDPGEANRLVGQLNTWMAESQMGLGQQQERFGFYLQSEDLDVLKTNPIKWLDSQFDVLYNLAQEGQELTSPIVNNMQTVVSEAMRYIQYNKPEELDRFQRLFTIRFNLIQDRTTIGYKSIQSIQEAAYRLGTHGLMYGLSLEDGRVGVMFNRLNELLEDERLKAVNFHVTPELVNALQDKLIREQEDLMDKGGIFAGKEKADVVRAVRTAFDAFVSSQRMAVIVARGKHLTELDAYFGDPASGPLNVYNLEDLLTEKFGIFNIHEQEFLRQMKLDMANTSLEKKWKKVKEVNPKSVSEKDKEDLGRRLFRDIFIVPDFFSSGWRVKGVLDALEERLGEEGAKELALFMRLRNAKEEEREAVWTKIVKYRPEEIVRLFRERDNGELSGLYERLQEIDNTLTPSAEESENGITSYDKFKDKYAGSLRILREQGFQKELPEQIDMAHLDDDQKAILNKALGDPEAGDKVVKIFTEMQKKIEEGKMIDTLMRDTKFEDIYTRTLLVDDALLSKLELDKWGEGADEKSVTPLSKRYGADQGGDALVRIWNDTANAIRGAQSLVKFVKTENGEERAKHALELADAASLYNGEENRAKIVRFTIGTFLNLSKQDFIWDALGVGKLPFRRAMSKIEQIYGPQAQPMSRDELRRQLDNINSVLVYHANDDLGKIKAEELYTELENLLEVTAKDAVKRRAVSVLFFLMLAALIEGYELSGVKEVAGRK